MENYVSLPLAIPGPRELRAAVGTIFGPTRWRTLAQADVDDFARLSGNGRLVLGEPKRPAVHGVLLLSLAPVFVHELVEVGGYTSSIAYGLGPVRFPSPSWVGDGVRAFVELVSVEGTPSGDRVVFRVLEFSPHGERPVCTADMIFLFRP